MPTHLDDRTLLRAPSCSVTQVPGGIVALDPQTPNWIATDERGLRVLASFDGLTPFGDIVKEYATRSGLHVARAWLHVETFARDALRQGFISTDGAVPAPYLGRSAYLITDQLRSYPAAHRLVMPSVPHCTDRYANNRAEVSHQPTRQRERQMRRFRSPAHLQHFASVHGVVHNLFRVGRHLLRRLTTACSEAEPWSSGRW